MREVSSEKMQAELEADQVSLKEREEELNNAKDELSEEQQRCQKLREEKQTMDLDYWLLPRGLRMLKLAQHWRRPVSYGWMRRLPSELLNLKGDLFVGKESAAAVLGFVTKFLGDCPQRLDMFNKFKEDWPEEYFEGLSVDVPSSEVTGGTTGVKNADGEVAEGEIGAVDDEAIS
ncbi:hypothetical protein LIER_43572 [Lithospermum erythrorhizon]|uniref:Uncharacterized protein n=1 Tax=Lithospermum erythrorhizon TaxID=34254 RepID=A0AAV3QG22_LITER